MIFKFQNYKITYSELIKHSTYDDGSCYGITFYIGKNQYNLNHNKVGWDRLILTEDGVFKDLPFNDNTLHFLPKEIGVEKL